MGNILCRLSCTEDQPEVESSERVPRRRKRCNPRRWFRKHVLSRRVAPKPLEETLDEVIEVCQESADEPVVDNITATSADVEHSEDEDSDQDLENIEYESQSLSDEPCTTSEEVESIEEEDSAQDVELEPQLPSDEPCTSHGQHAMFEETAPDVELLSLKSFSDSDWDIDEETIKKPKRNIEEVQAVLLENAKVIQDLHARECRGPQVYACSYKSTPAKCNDEEDEEMQYELTRSFSMPAALNLPERYQAFPTRTPGSNHLQAVSSFNAPFYVPRPIGVLGVKPSAPHVNATPSIACLPESEDGSFTRRWVQSIEDEDSAQDVELEPQLPSDEPCTSHGQSHAMFEETAPDVELLSLESFSDSDWDKDEETIKKPKRNIEEVQAVLLQNAKVIQDLHARECGGPQVYACSYKYTPAKCNDEEDEEMPYELTRSFSMPAALNLPERYQAFPSRTPGSNHLQAVSSFNAPFYVPRPVEVLGVKPSAPHVNARLSIAFLPESEDGSSTPRWVQKDTNGTNCEQPWHTKPSVFMTRSAVSQDKSFTEPFRTPDQAISVGAVEPWSRETQPNNAESPQDDEYPSTSYGGTR